MAGFTSGFIEKRTGEPFQERNGFIVFIDGLFWPLFYLWLLGYWISEKTLGD
jgi:hypothetical protein